MFLKSKWDLKIINTHKIDYPIKTEYRYSFLLVVYYINFGYYKWSYTNLDMRDEEYNWVLKQLTLISNSHSGNLRKGF